MGQSMKQKRAQDKMRKAVRKAKQIQKPGEKWQNAVKRAYRQV